MALFRKSTERERWASKLAIVTPEHHVGLAGLDPQTAHLYGQALPRGTRMARPMADRQPVNAWMRIAEAQAMRFVHGQILLGKIGATPIGYIDDRPMVTIAGARAGKTSTVLEPNLYLYPGSMLVLDPKGELARKTALFRRQLGHDVHVLDPFGQSGVASSCFNAMAELKAESDLIVDDVASICQALIVDEGDSRNKHWNDSARTLLQGIILLCLTLPPAERSLVAVRRLLTLTHPMLLDAVKATSGKRAGAQGDLFEGQAPTQEFYRENRVAVETLVHAMGSAGGRFGGILAAIGKRFEYTPPNERGSIFSTAAAQTDFLDSLPLRKISLKSAFRLKSLAQSPRPMTIYLCLPVGRMESHYRWLRMIVQQACTALEQLGPYPRTRPPIIFMMEEFATLGHMDLMERAAAYFPGFGVKLWAIIQDLTQLQRYYHEGWETFLGNAGVLQCFANSDQTTLEYLARRSADLIHPFELRTAFSRDGGGQVLMIEGKEPLAALRPSHEDVARIADAVRRRAPIGIQGQRSIP